MIFGLNFKGYTMETRIFLTDLQAYNEGHLVGKWITLPLTDQEWVMALNELLTEGEHIAGSEDHEEWFITDYEAEFTIDEYEDIDSLNNKAEIYSNLDDDDLIKIKYLVDYHGYNTFDAIEKLDDVELYEDTTMNDLAEMFIDEGLFGDIPDNLINYIDYDAVARDLSYDYDEVDHNILRVA